MSITPLIVRRRGGSVPPSSSRSALKRSPLNTSLTLSTARGTSTAKVSPSSPHYELGAKLLGTHSARKKAEQEVALMTNRIAHLQAEREKARKKVEETRARAQEILETKARNEAFLQAKRDTEERAALELAAEKEKQRQIKLERQEKLRQAREALAEKKRQDFINAKAEEYERKETIEADRRGLFEKKVGLRSSIRADKDVFRTQKLTIQQQREQELLNSILDKTSKEESDFVRNQALAQELERQEKQLLQDLKNAMLEQRDAFQDLQSVLKKR